MYLLYCVVQTIKPRKPPKRHECQAGASSVEQLSVADSSVSVVSAPVSHEPVDHTHHTKDSPRTMKRQLDNVMSCAEVVKKRLKYCNTRVRRLKVKVQSLKPVVVDLKKEHMISADCKTILNSTFSGVSLEVTKSVTSQPNQAKPSHKAYPDELKSFTMTLSFYSLKAYNYVRKTFKLALPHPSTVRMWYRGLNG
jgi:hypothetical protein